MERGIERLERGNKKRVGGGKGWYDKYISI